MSVAAKVSKLCMLAFLVTGQVQAQTTVNAAPQGASSFDHILRIMKTAMKEHTADVEVEVQQLSDKAITAYGLDLSMRYAAGNEKRTSVAYDLIRSLVPDVPGFPVDSPGLTRYGDYHSVTINLPSDDADAPPVAVTVAIAWVALDDRTVAGSVHAPGLQAVLAERRDESHYLADLVADFRAVEARPDVSAALAGSPSNSGQPVLQAAIEDLKRKTPEGPQTGIFGQRNADLQIFAVAAAVSKDKFDALLARYASLQTLIAEHCNLKADK
jgi:hypothetical protein